MKQSKLLYIFSSLKYISKTKTTFKHLEHMNETDKLENIENKHRINTKIRNKEEKFEKNRKNFTVGKKHVEKETLAKITINM